MNNTEIIMRLNAVVKALDNIYVKGESNLNNLGGSITIIRELRDVLINEPTEEAEE